jgi:hypothetical protein
MQVGLAMGMWWRDTNMDGEEGEKLQFVSGDRAYWEWSASIFQLMRVPVYKQEISCWLLRTNKTCFFKKHAQ